MKLKNKKVKCTACGKEWNDAFRVVDEFPKHKYQGKMLCMECIRRFV